MNKNLNFLIETLQDKLKLGHNIEESSRSLKGKGLFSDEDIDQAVKHILDLQDEYGNKAHTLRDKGIQGSWFSDNLLTSDGCWHLLKNNLSQVSFWEESMITSLDDYSTAVVKELAPPKSEKDKKVKGLVLGYVQSGKTTNFCAVAAKAIDSGYKLVIVLSGMHNNLRRQTELRLRKELVDPMSSRCCTLTSVDEKGDFKKKQTISANRALSIENGFTLVVLKKNSPVLRNFISWLSHAKKEIIENCPALIIDDESDQASVNTNKPENDPTAINGHIRNLLDTFKVCSYIGYTATPFANILINTDVNSDIFPKDFLVSLPKPKGYFGADELFNDIKAPFLDVLRNISEDEAMELNPRLRSQDRLEMQDSLKLAICDFVVSSAIRCTRGQWKQHMTMLVHTHHTISEHQKITDLIKEYVSDLKWSISEQNGEIFNYLTQHCLNEFNKNSEKFSKTIKYAKKQKVFRAIEKVCEELIVLEDNSKSQERLLFPHDEYLRAIVVGGNTLSRGLTINGLSVSYFSRHSKNYDTLLQMGRWFGYRKNYVDLTRLYVTSTLRDHFYHLSVVEKDLREEIENMALNKERPIDVALKILRHPELNVTAHNKARNAARVDTSFSGYKLQARHIDGHNKNILKKNKQAVEKLLIQSQKGNFQAVNAIKDFSPSHCYKDVPAEAIIQFLENYRMPKENIKFCQRQLINYIEKALTRNELSNWSVALISVGSRGTEYEINGLKCQKSKRSVLGSDFDSEKIQQLKALSTPIDEFIDLQDEISVEEFEKLKNSKTSVIQLRKKYRKKENALLLIHPLDYVTPEGESSETNPLRAVYDVFGISLVFPESNVSDHKYDYVANKSIA